MQPVVGDHEPREGDYIVVYGTLRRHGGAGPYMEGTEFISKAAIPGKLYHLGGFPGLKEGDGKVVGELYRVVDPSVFNLLDMYEGYRPTDEKNSLFIRRQVKVEGELDHVGYDISAWVYYYNGKVQDNHLIENGDWLS